MSRTGKTIERESRLVAVQDIWVGDNGEELLKGVEFLSGLIKVFWN